MDLSTLPTWLTNLVNMLSEPPLSTAFRVGAIAVGTLVLSSLANRRLHSRLLDAQQLMLLRRGVSSLIFGLGVVWILNELGVGLGPLLGAAGVLSVAVGFAAQTSVSNIISGIFLIGERPFVVGDLIEVAGTKGFVVSVELLSIKLRTLDNLMVRIPNESMLKSNLINYTHFPIRRVDVIIPVAHDADLGHVETVLNELAEQAPLSLAEPEPLFVIQEIAPSAINVQLSVWSLNADWLELKNDLLKRVQQSFAREGLELPVPRMALSAPSSDPVSVHVRGS